MKYTPLFLIFTAAALMPSSMLANPADFSLAPEQYKTFERDGVIIIRGLLKGKELKDATKAVKRLQRSRNLGQRLFYKVSPAYSNLEFQTWRKDRALERVAFESAAPTITAKLMGLDNVHAEDSNFRPLRLLKDAVLGYKEGDDGCGWHVDDRLFW
eukprot:310923_1